MYSVIYNTQKKQTQNNSIILRNIAKNFPYINDHHHIFLALFLLSIMWWRIADITYEWFLGF